MRIYAQLLWGQSGKKDIRRNLFQGMRSRVHVLFGTFEHSLFDQDDAVGPFERKFPFFFSILKIVISF